MPLLLGAGAVLLVAKWRTVPRGLALAGLAYTVMALSLDYAHVWQHVPSGERASIECFLAWLLVTILGAGRGGLGRAAACFWGVAAVYTFFVSPEAALSRAALGVLH